MAEMSPGAALRELQKVQAGMKKAREVMKHARANPRAGETVFAAGWESLIQAHKLMASIPVDAIDDDVLTKQLAVGRYATALLVRLRRLKRKGTADSGDIDDDDNFGNDDAED
jgi:hypothetical protein